EMGRGHLTFTGAQIDWRGRRLLQAPTVELGIHPHWVGKPRLDLNLHAARPEPVWSNLDAWVKEPGTKWRQTGRPILSQFLGWRLEVSRLEMRMAGNPVRLDAWVDDRLRGAVRGEGGGLRLEAEGDWGKQEALWSLEGSLGFGKIKGRGKLRRDPRGGLEVKSDSGRLEGYETFGVLPGRLDWKLTGAWHRGGSGLVRFDWEGGRATAKFSLDTGGGLESLTLSDTVWENVVWGPRRLGRLSLDADLVGKSLHVTAHGEDLESSLPFVKVPLRSKSVDLAWDGTSLEGVLSGLGIGKGEGRLRFSAKPPWKAWELHLDLREIDLGLLGAPPASGVAGPKVPWPMFYGNCRLESLRWKDEWVHGIEGDWEWKAPSFTVGRFSGMWKRSPLSGSLAYHRDSDSGELRLQSGEALVEDLWKRLHPEERGTVTGTLAIDAWAHFSSRGLSGWGGLFSNRSSWHLDRTSLQDKLWSSPLVSSLKSQEDFIQEASGEAAWSPAEGIALSNGRILAEGFRFLIPKATSKDGAWSARFALAMEDDFLNRYLIPSAAVRARGKRLERGTYPAQWESAYGLDLFLEKRPDGKMHYELR
ncbi:MAG: hypothetical protein J0L75_19105, partial [Spirochaetes bacterium]|nr:hypothetical protein [Spirochaetota bacterium]